MAASKNASRAIYFNNVVFPNRGISFFIGINQNILILILLCTIYTICDLSILQVKLAFN